MDGFIQLLLAATAPETGERAGSILAHYQDTKGAECARNLIVVLSTAECPPSARNMAGIILRRTICKLPVEQREMGCSTLLRLLHDSLRFVRVAAANALAALLSQELVEDRGIPVVIAMCEIIKDAKSEFGVHASLIAIGQICELQPRPPSVRRHGGDLVTVLFHGVNMEKNARIVLAALLSLRHALPFTSHLLYGAKRSAFALNALFNAISRGPEDVRGAALSCLAELAEYAQPVITVGVRRFVEYTTRVMREGINKDSVRAAIECWRRLAIEEGRIPSATRVITLETATVFWDAVQRFAHDITTGEPDDTTSLSKAVARALYHMTPILGDAIVDLVDSFVRKAGVGALIVLAAIQRTPKAAHLVDVVSAGLVPALKAGGDVSVHAMQCLYGIAGGCSFSIPVLSILLTAARDHLTPTVHPALQCRACWIFTALARRANPPRPLIEHVVPLCEVLLRMTVDPAGLPDKVLTSAYFCLRSVLPLCPDGAYIHDRLLPELLERREWDTVASVVRSHTELAKTKASYILRAVFREEPSGSLCSVVRDMFFNLGPRTAAYLEVGWPWIRRAIDIPECCAMALIVGSTTASAIGMMFMHCVEPFIRSIRVAMDVVSQDEDFVTAALEGISSVALSIKKELLPHMSLVGPILAMAREHVSESERVLCWLLAAHTSLCVGLGTAYRPMLLHTVNLIKEIPYLREHSDVLRKMCLCLRVMFHVFGTPFRSSLPAEWLHGFIRNMLEHPDPGVRDLALQLQH